MRSMGPPTSCFQAAAVHGDRGGGSFSRPGCQGCTWGVAVYESGWLPGTGIFRVPVVSPVGSQGGGRRWACGVGGGVRGSAGPGAEASLFPTSFTVHAAPLNVSLAVKAVCARAL